MGLPFSSRFSQDHPNSTYFVDPRILGGTSEGWCPKDSIRPYPSLPSRA